MESLIINTEKITINFAKYDIDSFYNNNELFSKDLYVRYSRESGSHYIQDTHNDLWYSIEHKYYYADLRYLIESNLVVEFYKIDDKEIIDDLENEFN